MTSFVSMPSRVLATDLTVYALNMFSRPRYLCKKLRSGIAERCAQVAAKAKAPAGVMLGTKLHELTSRRDSP